MFLKGTCASFTLSC